MQYSPSVTDLKVQILQADGNILSAAQYSPSGNIMDILSAVQSFCQRCSGTDPLGRDMCISSAVQYSPSITDLQVQILQEQIWIF